MQHFPVIPWNTFIEHVRVNVNPLAADDHMKEVIQQLQLMGEVIYVKGSVCVDVIVLEPKWLSSHVLGALLSPDFARKAPVSGFYTCQELRSIPAIGEAIESTLPILESLGLCAKVRARFKTQVALIFIHVFFIQMDLETTANKDCEYEFPYFNQLEAPEGIWSADKMDKNSSLYGGVLLKTGTASCKSQDRLLRLMLPRIQAQLRRQFVMRSESSTDLLQWAQGSKYFIGNVEGMLSLKNQGHHLEVRVRAPAKHEKECFFFLEEILGVIDQV